MGNRRFSEFVEIIGKAMPISRAMYKMYHNSYNLLIEAIVSRAICSRFSHAHFHRDEQSSSSNVSPTTLLSNQAINHTGI
jgi:hypothetical protein